MQRPGDKIQKGFREIEAHSFESLIPGRAAPDERHYEIGVVRSLPTKAAKPSRDLSDRVAHALTLLRSGRRSERIGAARELGDTALTRGVKIPEAVIPLTVTLATDVDPCVREEAAWSLWKIGDPRSHKALIRAILDDRSAAVREKCARVLGLMGAREAVPVMFDLLTLERHVPARLRAGMACAFGYLAEEFLLDNLIKLAKDAEPRVRYEAVRSLGRYLVGFSDDIAEKVFNLLTRYMKTSYEPCGMIRKAAVKALRFSRSDRATRTVVKALLTDPDAETRQTAADALIIWDNADTEKALIGALEDDCWQVRKAASRTLAKFIIRYGVYDSPAVCEAMRRMERMLPAHSLEWRLAADAFASL